MVRCKQCNAPVSPGHDVCDFCGTLTPEGYAKRAAEAQRLREEREAEEARLEAEARAERERQAAAQRAAREQQWLKVLSRGTGALVLSIIGVVMMCLPIFSLIGLVLGLLARSTARQTGFPTPARATAAIVVGGAGFVLGAGFWVLAGYLAVEEENRKTELRATVGKGAAAEELDAATACALTELQLLETSYEGYTISSEFECAQARMVPAGGRAALHDASIAVAGDSQPLVACFTRAGSWKVAELRKDERCGNSTEPGKDAAPAQAGNAGPGAGNN